MSSPKEKSKKGFSILAVSRRKKSKEKSARDSPDSSSIGSREFSGTEIPPDQVSVSSSSAAVTVASEEHEKMAAEVADLARQLQEAQDEADSLRGTNAMEREKIAEFEIRLRETEDEAQKWKEKATKYENVSADLDDESFDAAHEFQLKRELEKLQGELGTHEKLNEELMEAKQNLSELRAHCEELELQQSRKTTRTDIERIRSEKSTREEVDRLHKELRQMERTFKSQSYLVEAQLKISKDSLLRAGEKTQALQRRMDLLDKEKMDLKLENQKLNRKLEKMDSYEVKKRAQLEAETQELQIANLKRKTAKLEKRLSMSITNLDQINETGLPSPTSSALSSGTTSPISMTLGEARIYSLEKEVNELEKRNTALANESETFKDMLAKAEQNSVLLTSQLKDLQNSLSEGKKDLEEATSKLTEYKSTALPLNDAVEGSEQDLQQQVTKLSKALELRDTEARVRIHEIKELNKQVEQLEMDKLRAELGEDVDGEQEGEEEEGEGDLTDTEEDNVAISNAKSSADTEIRNLRERLESLQNELQTVSENNEQLKAELAKQKTETVSNTKASDDEENHNLRERLDSLQGELQFVSKNNEQLKAELVKQKTETEIFMQSIESELSDVAAAEVEESREQRLEKRNEELKTKLREQQEMYNDTIREIARLKSIIAQQVWPVFLFKSCTIHLKITIIIIIAL